MHIAKAQIEVLKAGYSFVEKVIDRYKN